MDLKVQFLSLQKTELEYEVSVRGESPAASVEDLRKQIVRLVSHPLLQDVLESHLNPQDDLIGFGESYSKLVTNIKLLKTKFEKNLYSRSLNLFNHLSLRLGRITPVESEEKSKHAEFFSKLSLCYKELNVLSPPSSKIVNTEQESSFVPNVNRADSTLPPSTHISVTCDRGLSTDIPKIKFDGTGCVRAFIEKVSEFTLARNIEPNKMLCFATEMFTGNALHWYRNVRKSIKSWDELVVLLKQDFDPVDYDYRLMSEIQNRTQGETENITIYFAIMSGMFSRLSEKLSEDRKLQILLHNIRPCYTDTLAANPNIVSIESLRTKCRNYEVFQSRRAQFREPPKQSQETLAPEFVYTRPSTSNGSQHKNYTAYKPFSNAAIDCALDAIASPSNSRSFFCPRCRSNDHSLKMCQEPRTPVCFKCGKKDVIFPNCPVCHTKN